MHFFLLLLLLTRAKTPCFAMRIPPTDQDPTGEVEDSRSEYLERRLRTFRKATEDDLAASVGNVVFNQPFPAEYQRGQQAYLPQTVRDCYDQELVGLMPLRVDPNAESEF